MMAACRVGVWATLWSSFPRRLRVLAVNDAPPLETTSPPPEAEGPTVEQLQAELRRLTKAHDVLKQQAGGAIKRRDRERELKPYQAELIKMQQQLEKDGRKMIILFEGRDAAGKGGTLRRVTRYMNEKHYRVVALGKPSDVHRTQWYFQRYVAEFPRGGEIVLFDRSWYNRAMVEPVFGFCTTEEYDNFMAGVTTFEKELVRNGVYLLKLYFSVTRSEQALRFERRKTDPLRQWKLSEVDLQAQEHWDDFTDVKYKMLKRTHSTKCPWTIVRSNDKHQARLNVMRVILNSVNYEGRDTSLDFVPNSKVVVSGSREIETMEAERIRRGRFSG